MAAFTLPPFHALGWAVAHPDIVKAAVESLALADWNNSYQKEPKFHVGLVELLTTPEGSAWVREKWGWAQTNKTVAPSLLEVVQNTSKVVLEVMKALDLNPTVPLDMQSKLPPGKYLYAIGFAGEDVIKTGVVTIHDPAASAKGKGKCPHGLSQQFCVGDRFKGHLKSQVLPVEFKGQLSLECMSLIHLVPAPHGCRNEAWVQVQLRKRAGEPVEPPYLQCKSQKGGATEFVDKRLQGLAFSLMDQVAISPDKCQKEVGKDVDSEDIGPEEPEAKDEAAGRRVRPNLAFQAHLAPLSYP